MVAGALANLYLLEIDLTVEERLRKDNKHHILHFRYVDDHLFLSENAEKLIEWKGWYIQELNKIGLNVNAAKTDTEPIELDSRYPTPLLTQTLHKISEIAKMPLDLLSTNEFSMVFRDLQMLLVTDFPEQEIKKEQEPRLLVQCCHDWYLTSMLITIRYINCVKDGWSVFPN